MVGLSLALLGTGWALVEVGLEHYVGVRFVSGQVLRYLEFFSEDSEQLQTIDDHDFICDLEEHPCQIEG